MKSENYVEKGVAHGEVAKTLMSGNSVAQYRPIRSSVNMAALPKRAWEKIDESILRVAKEMLVGIGDLNRAAGVPINFDGMTAATYQLYKASDMSPAYMNMSPDTRGEADVLDFSRVSVPLPVTVKDFWVNTKQVSMASTEGVDLAAYAAEEATFQVALELEETLFNGNFTAVGSTIYGYTTFPDRNTVAISDWANVATAKSTIISDVIAMTQASIDKNHFGPWMMYIPSTYQSVMSEDYLVETSEYPTGQTVRERILQIPGIQDIKMSRQLANNNVILIEMSARTIRLLNGMPMTAVDWEPPGSPNWNHNFKAIAMTVPFIHADYNGQCGLVHGSV